MSPHISIGTVQFGLNYGITNSCGKVDEENVAQILSNAHSYSFTGLDTAQAYGDAEAVLGRNLPLGCTFQIVSKFPSQSTPCFSSQDHLLWENNFLSSLDRLGVTQLEAFLLHDVADLKKMGSEYLTDWLLSLKSRGLVNRLGVSIYESNDLNGVPASLLDLVQLPLSLYDQRLLIDGTINYLHSMSCSIHARSIYLQGLLLTPVSSWPSWVHPKTKSHHSKLEELAIENGITLLDLALGFVRAQHQLESVVVGVCSVEQLSQLNSAWSQKLSPRFMNWQDWQLNDPIVLDPRAWPK